MLSRRLIQDIWQRRGLWSQLGWLALTPFSLAFSAAIRGRNLLYDLNFLPIEQLTLNVISVGNLTVGGTGKTPLVLWLARALQNRGYRVGILTRGYKGVTTDTEVTIVGTEGKPLATPTEVGDEAVMMARLFEGVVIAGRDRVAAAVRARLNFGLDVLILDDGFQYRRLQRDVDILLVGGQRLDNRWLLPAGPLREPFTAARRASVVIITKSTEAKTGTHHFSSQRYVNSFAPVFHGDLVPTALVSSVHGEWHEYPLTRLAGKRIVAVTGIATPAPFYRTLHEWEADIVEVIEFPDHHEYTLADWQTIVHISRTSDLIVTTEKDLVKLERFPFASGRLVALRAHMRIEPAGQVLAAIEEQFRYKKMDINDHGRSLSYQGSQRPTR